MALSLIARPAVEPVTLSDLKHQLGLSPNEDADHVKEAMTAKLLRRHIKVARSECEKRTRRAFIAQTWKYTREGFGRCDPEYTRSKFPGFWIPKPPFQSIVSFQYVDQAGTTQTLDTAGYQIDPGGETMPARITAPYQAPWPILRSVPANVSLTVVCGFGDTGDAVPAEIQQAILFLAHSYYDPGNFKNVDGLVDSLLSGYVNHIA